MLRFLGIAILVVALAATGGYFWWGTRVGNLTEALNNMILEQDALRAQLAASNANKPAAGPGNAGGAGLGEGADGGEILMAVNALKKEVQFQAKLIGQQSRVIKQMVDEGGATAGLSTCRETAEQLRQQVQRLSMENRNLRTLKEANGDQPWPNPQPPGVQPPAIPPPRY